MDKKKRLKQPKPMELSPTLTGPVSLWRFGDIEFEEFCCDILDEEVDTKRADIFGPRGHSDYGVDITAECHDGTNTVAQCKCYEKFPPAEIRKAVSDFTEHWESYWRTQKVRKFVLYTACNLRTRDQHDALDEIKTELAALNVEFETVQNHDIIKKIRPHERIVRKYFRPPEFFVEHICGSKATAAAPALRATPASSLDVTTAATISSIIGRDTDQGIEYIRGLFRQGHHAMALQRAAELCADPTRWSLLSPVTQGKLLRIEASMKLLTSNDVTAAEALAEQAEAIDPPKGSSALRALIAWAKRGAAEGLAVLDSPQAVADQILKASLLIEAEQVDEAEALLDTLQTDTVPEISDIHRLRSVIAFARRDIKKALSHADDAVSTDSASLLARLTKGHILFYAAIAPSARPQLPYHLPDPVDWVEVKRDDESQTRLKIAGDIFRAAAAVVNNVSNPGSQYHYWILATLCCRPAATEEAEAYSRSLVDQSQADPVALAWALSRGYLRRSTLERSRRALGQLLDGGGADMPHIIALVAICIQLRKYEKARSFLQRTRSAFEESGNLEIWLYWASLVPKMRRLLELSMFDEHRRYIHTRISLIRNNTDRPGAIAQTISLGRFAMEGTVPRSAIAAIWTVLVDFQQWSFIADSAEFVLRSIGTADAVEMVAISLTNAGRYDGALATLTTHAHTFPNGELPLTLRRLRVDLQRRLGQLPEAIRDARQIADATKDPEDIHRLIDTAIRMGDLNQVAQTVAWGRSIPGVTPRDLVAYASVVMRTNPTLSASILRDAVKQELPRDLIGPTYLLTMRLGLPDEFVDIGRKFHSLAARGELDHVQAVSVEDVITFVQSRRLAAENAQARYDSGLQPVHALTTFLGRSLADIYHPLLIERETNLRFAEQQPVYIRSGARPVSIGLPDSADEWYLVMDISALLLSHHLELLPALNQTYSKIYIPHALPLALQALSDGAAVGQPDRVRAARHVVALAAASKLAVCENAEPPISDSAGEGTEKPGATQTYFVSWDKSDVPDNGTDAQLPITLAELCRAGHSRGLLDQGQLATVLRKLGHTSEENGGGMDIPKGSRIVLDAGCDIELARTEALESLCGGFQICVSRADIERLRGEVRQADRGESLATWLDALRTDVQLGISSGRYISLPVTTPSEPPATHEEAKAILADDPVLQCLFGALSAPNGAKRIVWIDDRRVSSFDRIDSHPLVTTYEILLALRKYGSISNDEYFIALMRLRKAFVCYLPIANEEIIFHLRQAPVDDGEVIETTNLSVLRRYFARVLVLGNSLLPPNLSERRELQRGELPFVFDTSSAVRQVLVSIWQDASWSNEIKKSMGSWVLNSLFYIRLNIDPSWMNGADAGTKLAALFFSGLLVNALQLSWHPKGGEGSEAEAYLEWIWDTLLDRVLTGAPDLVTHVIDTLALHTINLLEGDHGDNIEGISHEDTLNQIQFLIRRLFSSLPELLGRRLLDRPDVDRALELADMTSVTLSQHQFRPVELWAALAEASTAKDTTLKTRDGSVEFKVRAIQETTGELLFTFDDPAAKMRFSATGPQNAIFQATPAARLESLQRHAAKFDLPRDQQDGTLKRLANLDDPGERISAVLDLLRGSCIEQYRVLAENVRQKGMLGVRDLEPPSAFSLLTFLRIAPASTQQVDLSAIAAQMIDELGIVDAVRRLSGLPCPMPESVIKGLRVLPSDERIGALRAIGDGVGTPLDLFHFAHIASELDHADNLEVRRRVESLVTDPKLMNILASFNALLLWSSRYIDRRYQVERWPLKLRTLLAWSHAHQCLSALMTVGGPDENFPAWLRQQTYIEETLTDEDRITSPADVAEPQFLDPLLIFILGMGYALEKGHVSLDEGSITPIKALVYKTESERLVQIATLLRDTETASNETGSFMGRSVADALTISGIADAHESYGVPVLSRHLAGLLSLPEGTKPMDLFASVYTMFPYRNIPLQHVGAFVAFVHRTDFADLVRDAGRATLPILLYLVQYAIQSKNTALLAHLRQQLFVLARCATDGTATQSGSGLNCGELLVAGAWEVCQAESTPDERLRVFAEVTDELAIIYPDALEVVRHVLTRLQCEPAYSTTRQLWRRIASLRSRP